MNAYRGLAPEMKAPVRLLAAICLVSAAALAEGVAAADAKTVAIHFNLPPGQLERVTDSAGLTEALHQGLELDAVSPLDFDVLIQLIGHVYQDRSQQPHPAESGIIIELTRKQPASGAIREQRFYTYGDFSEGEAWKHFQQKIESAVLYSMNATGAFQAQEDGTVPLAVSQLPQGSREIRADGRSMILEVTADVLYRDDARFGSRSPPEGYRQDLRTVLLLLSPADARPASQESSAEARSESEVAMEPAAQESTGVTGIYGIDDGGLLVESLDGTLFMSNPRANDGQRYPLEPVGENRFHVNYSGTPVDLVFSVDDSGRAFAMTIVQGDHEMKMPRKE